MNTLKSYVIDEQEARRLVNAGKTVYAVYEANNTFRLFNDEEAAWVWAEKFSTRVLDWETGEYT